MVVESAPVGASVCAFTLSILNISKTANRNQILSEASLRRGKGCIRFWARSDQNSDKISMASDSSH